MNVFLNHIKVQLKYGNPHIYIYIYIIKNKAQIKWENSPAIIIGSPTM